MLAGWGAQVTVVDTASEPVDDAALVIAYAEGCARSSTVGRPRSPSAARNRLAPRPQGGREHPDRSARDRCERPDLQPGGHTAAGGQQCAGVERGLAARGSACRRPRRRRDQGARPRPNAARDPRPGRRAVRNSTACARRSGSCCRRPAPVSEHTVLPFPAAPAPGAPMTPPRVTPASTPSSRMTAPCCAAGPGSPPSLGGVVIIRTPYGAWRHGDTARAWAGRGYRCVIHDVRGRHSSDGGWHPYLAERSDGRAGGRGGQGREPRAPPRAVRRLVRPRTPRLEAARAADVDALVLLVPALGLAETAWDENGRPHLHHRIGWWHQHGRGARSQPPR